MNGKGRVNNDGSVPGSAKTTGQRSAVRFDDVSKIYGDVAALSNVNVNIRVGETVALLGPNGAGKSTSIGIMLGLHHASSGVAEVLGLTPEEAVASGRVGAMLQTAGLINGVTVRELVDFIRKLYPNPMREDELLELADLTALANRSVHQLSGEEAQRVRFAFAIAGNPDLIFLDEPTVAMDVESRRTFWNTMRGIAASGRTVLFATHYLEEADSVADRIIMLSHGRIVADGSATEIKSSVSSRVVKFTLDDAHRDTLTGLPGISDVKIHGNSVEIHSADSDAMVRALALSSLEWRDLEVSGAGIEDAFLALAGKA